MRRPAVRPASGPLRRRPRRALLLGAALTLAVGLAACDINPAPPTPRPQSDHPTVAVFGDSLALDAQEQLTNALEQTGYNVVLYHGVLGGSMCLDAALINNVIQTYKIQLLVLQYVGNNSFWNCVDGYDAAYRLYDDAIREIGLNAAFNGAPGGTHVFLVGPTPDTNGQPTLPESPAVTDVFLKWAGQAPDTFTFVDTRAGLTPGPGARQTCYPWEIQCGEDGRVQVRANYRNPITGETVVGGDVHFCLEPEWISFYKEVCHVPNWGATRFAFDIVDAMRATGL